MLYYTPTKLRRLSETTDSLDNLEDNKDVVNDGLPLKSTDKTPDIDEFKSPYVEPAITDHENFEESFKHPAFRKVVNEYFDLSDKTTRHMIKTINEADQAKVLESLASRLYNNVVAKVDYIDFGEIPESKGDITKLSNYTKLVDCCVIIKDLLKQYKQDSEAIDTVADAIANLQKRKDIFERAYKFDVELPIIVYSSITLACISSISLLIATCIEFIKEPNQESYSLVLDKVSLTKTKQHLLFNNLKKFNKSCRSGEMDKALDYVIKQRTKSLTGGIAVAFLVGTVAVVALILNIIPILRELVFFFFYSRTRVSDYFDTQADLLQINAHRVEMNDTLDPNKKEKILRQQYKMVDLLRNISNKINIKSKEAEVRATKDIHSSDRKYKAGDIVETLPDSSSSAIF